jgi:hypothetical protein
MAVAGCETLDAAKNSVTGGIQSTPSSAPATVQNTAATAADAYCDNQTVVGLLLHGLAAVAGAPLGLLVGDTVASTACAARDGKLP